jgi:hypothetical protein
MMKAKSSPTVSAFFLLIGLGGMIIATSFHDWESVTLPLMTSSLVVILAGVQLVRDLVDRRRKEPNENTSRKESGQKEEIKRGLKICGWAAAFVLAAYLAGFYIAIPVMSMAYLKSRGRSWVTAIIFAGVFTVIIYLIFAVLLKATLYNGRIFSLF